SADAEGDGAVVAVAAGVAGAGAGAPVDAAIEDGMDGAAAPLHAARHREAAAIIAVRISFIVALHVVSHPGWRTVAADRSICVSPSDRGRSRIRTKAASSRTGSPPGQDPGCGCDAAGARDARSRRPPRAGGAPRRPRARAGPRGR